MKPAVLLHPADGVPGVVEELLQLFRAVGHFHVRHSFLMPSFLIPFNHWQNAVILEKFIQE